MAGQRFRGQGVLYRAGCERALRNLRICLRMKGGASCYQTTLSQTLAASRMGMTTVVNEDKEIQSGCCRASDLSCICYSSGLYVQPLRTGQ